MRNKRAIIDALEPRLLLATYNTGSANDTINISTSGGVTHIVINGLDNATGDTSIDVNCGAGADVVHVSSMRSTSTIHVHGEDGDDTLANTGGDLDAQYSGDLQFDGGAGNDDVVADNVSDSTTAANIDIQNNGIVKNLSAFLVRYVDIEGLIFYDSNGSNRIGFINLQGPQYDITDVTIKGNGGNDIFANTSSNSPSSGYWPTSMGTGGVRVDGGPGIDSVRVNDAGEGGAIFTIGADTVDVDSFGNENGPLTYVLCETVDIFATNVSDILHINGEAAGTTMYVDSGDGGDTYFAGNGDIDSNGFVFTNTTLTGGAGTDSIRFEDQLDRDASGETESYALDIFTLTKGAAGFNYNSFESQTIDTGDGVSGGQFVTTPTVNINKLSGQLNSTAINGGVHRLANANVVGTTGNLVNLSGTLTLLNCTHIDVNDVNGAGPTSSWEINNSQIRKTSTGQTINYSGVTTQIVVNTSSFSDAVNVKSTRAGMTLFVNASGGNDNLFLGNGNIDTDLLGPVVLNANSGTDFLTINNSLDNTLETMTLNSTSLIDGLTNSFTSIDGTMTVNLGPGGTNLTVTGTQTNTNINGDAGDETLTIGGGDIDANMAATVAKGTFFDARGGHNTLRFNDINDTNVDLYIFKQANGLDQFDKRDGGIDYFVTWDGVEAVTLDASNAPISGVTISTILVNSIAAPLRINGNGGPDAIQVEDAFSPVTVNSGSGNDNLSVNSDFDATGATVVFDQSDDIENLSVYNGGTVRVMPGAVLCKTRLGLNPDVTIDGVLDLAGGAFLSRAGGPTPAAFRTQIARGRNGGAWNGTGTGGAINSSLAASSSLPDGIGYGFGAEIAMTTIGPFSIAAGDTLMRYTYYGDADLNGVVDFDDYSRIDAGFNNNRTGWVNGDVDYNGVIDFDDYSLIDQAFNNQIAGRPGAAKGGRS